ncbi:MATE family efflux transporter [Streptomyces sp. NPDC102395]|uniref:MATE family efflux transporter n=1 Tax=Streptomyces sp. NPDC102395 TaxID=3366168 RepID=UPI003811E686
MGVGMVTAVGNQVAAADARAESAEPSGSAQDEVRDLVLASLLLSTLVDVRWSGPRSPFSPAWRPDRSRACGSRRYGSSPSACAGRRPCSASPSPASPSTPGLNARLAPVLSLSIWKTRPATLRRLAGLGTPIAATYGSEAGFFFVVALFAGSFGTSALAAYTAVNQLAYIVFQIAVGLSHAASIGVSRELALHNPAAAQRLKTTALVCAAAVMAVVGLVYVTAPGLVLAPFFDSGDGRAVEIARQLLLVAAALQFFDCAQNIGVGLLRGLDDTKGGFRVTLVGYWLVGLPAAALLGVAAGVDTLGIWLGLLIGLATTAVLLLRRFDRSLGRLPRPAEPAQAPL